MIRNLTPHAVAVIDDGGNVIKTFLPEGVPARVDQVTVPSGYRDPESGVEIHLTKFGDVIDLPEPIDNVFLIVSMPVVQRSRARRGTGDLLIPVELVRDEEGRIIGCRALAATRESILAGGEVYVAE